MHVVNQGTSYAHSGYVDLLYPPVFSRTVASNRHRKFQVDKIANSLFFELFGNADIDEDHALRIYSDAERRSFSPTETIVSKWSELTCHALDYRVLLEDLMSLNALKKAATIVSVGSGAVRFDKRWTKTIDVVGSIYPDLFAAFYDDMVQKDEEEATNALSAHPARLLVAEPGGKFRPIGLVKETTDSFQKFKKSLAKLSKSNRQAKIRNLIVEPGWGYAGFRVSPSKPTVTKKLMHHRFRIQDADAKLGFIATLPRLLDQVVEASGRLESGTITVATPYCGLAAIANHALKDRYSVSWHDLHGGSNPTMSVISLLALGSAGCCLILDEYPYVDFVVVR